MTILRDNAILAAIDPNGALGLSGHLPWHEPDDLAFFRQTTLSHTMVMGYETYRSMPDRAFEGRESFVFTRGRPVDPRHGKAVLSVEELPLRAPCFIIGGRQIFDLFFSRGLIDRAIITHIHACYEADVFFDLSTIQNWPSKIRLEHPRFTIREYTRP
jgi:dihydrofolate reductase